MNFVQEEENNKKFLRYSFFTAIFIISAPTLLKKQLSSYMSAKITENLCCVIYGCVMLYVGDNCIMRSFITYTLLQV
jgi:hypothetical protein